VSFLVAALYSAPVLGWNQLASRGDGTVKANECVYDEPLPEHLDAGITLTQGPDDGSGPSIYVRNYYAKNTKYEGLDLSLTIENGSKGREGGDGVTPGQEWSGYMYYTFNVSRTEKSPRFFKNHYKFAVGIHRANMEAAKYYYFDEEDAKSNVGSCSVDEQYVPNRVEYPITHITVQRYLPT
jgi:hypothetical protein